MKKFAMTKVNGETQKKELTTEGKFTIGAIVAGFITGAIVIAKKILTDGADEPTTEETQEPTNVCSFEEEPVREDEIEIQATEE